MTGITWSDELDNYIPVALFNARQKFTGDITNKSGEVIDWARRLMVHKFMRLRHTLTVDLLCARITELNKNRTGADTLWIAQPPEVPRKEATSEVPPVVPAAAVTTDDTVPATPSVQASLPITRSGQNIMANMVVAIKDLATNQGELVDTHKLLFEELCKFNTNANRQNELLEEQNANLTSLLSYYRDREKIAARVTLTKKETQPIKQPVLTQVGRVIDVRYEDVCWGENWDKVSSVPLSRNEQDWLDVFRLLQLSKWVSSARHAHADLESIAIYGRNVELHEIQMVFHRLGPKRVVWMRTFSSDDLDSDNIGAVSPKFGKVAIIVQKGVTPAAVKRIEDLCPGYDIRYVTLFGEKIRPGACTDFIAHFLLTRVFTQEYADVQQHRMRRAQNVSATNSSGH